MSRPNDHSNTAHEDEDGWSYVYSKHATYAGYYEDTTWCPPAPDRLNKVHTNPLPSETDTASPTTPSNYPATETPPPPHGIHAELRNLAAIQRRMDRLIATYDAPARRAAVAPTTSVYIAAQMASGPASRGVSPDTSSGGEHDDDGDRKFDVEGRYTQFLEEEERDQSLAEVLDAETTTRVVLNAALCVLMAMVVIMGAAE